jgi:hypothetical protein
MYRLYSGLYHITATLDGDCWYAETNYGGDEVGYGSTPEAALTMLLGRLDPSDPNRAGLSHLLEAP